MLLCACPAPKYNHLIVNRSGEVLEVEYEYVLPSVKYDDSRITTPAKTSAARYEDENAENIWQNLNAEKDFQIEMRVEEMEIKVHGANKETSSQTVRIATVKLQLQPNEILRVFVSEHINSEIKNLKRITLKSKKGNLKIEGEGFEQFNEYRTGGFFSVKSDFRIVFK